MTSPSPSNRATTKPGQSAPLGVEARQIAVATRTLVLLNEQAHELRTDLANLRHALEEVQRDFNGNRVAQLMEANQQLARAASEAEATAATAVSDFGELTRSSQRDVLTDTPNRALMRDRLEGAITMAQRRGTRIAIVFVDLDHFKQINDTLGHAVGDEVLQLAARRLESVIRESDTVSRHGGDEFLVLLTEIAQPPDATLIARKMLSDLAAPSLVNGHVLRLSASLGIAIYPEDGQDAGDLINQADAAMYRAKRGGGGRLVGCAGDASSRHPPAGLAGLPPARAQERPSNSGMNGMGASARAASTSASAA